MDPFKIPDAKLYRKIPRRNQKNVHNNSQLNSSVTSTSPAKSHVSQDSVCSVHSLASSVYTSLLEELNSDSQSKILNSSSDLHDNIKQFSKSAWAGTLSLAKEWQIRPFLESCKEKKVTMVTSKSNFNKKIVTFESWWCILTNDLNLCVQGKLENKNVVCQSEPIIKRMNSRAVASQSSLYKLKGDFNSQDSVQGIPSFIKRRFHCGFPEDWKLLKKLWTRFIQEGQPRNFHWNEKSSLGDMSSVKLFDNIQHTIGEDLEVSCVDRAPRSVKPASSGLEDNCPENSVQTNKTDGLLLQERATCFKQHAANESLIKSMSSHCAHKPNIVKSISGNVPKDDVSSFNMFDNRESTVCRSHDVSSGDSEDCSAKTVSHELAKQCSANRAQDTQTNEFFVQIHVEQSEDDENSMKSKQHQRIKGANNLKEMTAKILKLPEILAEQERNLPIGAQLNSTNLLTEINTNRNNNISCKLPIKKNSYTYAEETGYNRGVNKSYTDLDNEKNEPDLCVQNHDTYFKSLKLKSPFVSLKRLSVVPECDNSEDFSDSSNQSTHALIKPPINYTKKLTGLRSKTQTNKNVTVPSSIDHKTTNKKNMLRPTKTVKATEDNEIVLADWFPMCDKNFNTLHFKGFRIEGDRRIPHKTLSVKVRKGSNVVELADGKICRLVGPYCDAHNNIPAEVKADFEGGIPRCWRKTLSLMCENGKNIRTETLSKINPPTLPMENQKMPQLSTRGRVIVQPLKYWLGEKPQSVINGRLKGFTNNSNHSPKDLIEETCDNKPVESSVHPLSNTGTAPSNNVNPKRKQKAEDADLDKRKKRTRSSDHNSNDCAADISLQKPRTRSRTRRLTRKEIVPDEHLSLIQNTKEKANNENEVESSVHPINNTGTASSNNVNSKRKQETEDSDLDKGKKKTPLSDHKSNDCAADISLQKPRTRSRTRRLPQKELVPDEHLAITQNTKEKISNENEVCGSVQLTNSSNNDNINKVEEMNTQATKEKARNKNRVAGSKQSKSRSKNPNKAQVNPSKFLQGMPAVRKKEDSTKNTMDKNIYDACDLKCKPFSQRLSNVERKKETFTSNKKNKKSDDRFEMNLTAICEKPDEAAMSCTDLLVKPAHTLKRRKQLDEVVRKLTKMENKNVDLFYDSYQQSKESGEVNWDTFILMNSATSVMIGEDTPKSKCGGYLTYSTPGTSPSSSIFQISPCKRDEALRYVHQQKTMDSKDKKKKNTKRTKLNFPSSSGNLTLDAAYTELLSGKPVPDHIFMKHTKLDSDESSSSELDSSV